MTDFNGKRVLITGAAGGIGRCTADEFARAGARLVLTDVDRGGLEAVAERLRAAGTEVLDFVCDVSDRDAVERIAARVRAELGGLDVLVNNAGIAHHAELASTSLATWVKLMAVNFWGPLYHVYAFLPAMKAARSGHIVNVSSGQAYFQLPTWGAYTASKVALGVFSEVLHYELRPHGITVTTVYPFMVNTGLYDGVEGETMVGRLAMKLLPWYSMRPERVARAVRRAVERGRRVERTSLLNEMARVARFAPFVPGLIGRVGYRMLA